MNTVNQQLFFVDWNIFLDYVFSAASALAFWIQILLFEHRQIDGVNLRMFFDWYIFLDYVFPAASVLAF